MKEKSAPAVRKSNRRSTIERSQRTRKSRKEFDDGTPVRSR